MTQPEAFDQLQRHLASQASKPTFDQWHLAKHGVSFEQRHMQPGGRVEDTMRALTHLVRDYVSEMVRT